MSLLRNHFALLLLFSTERKEVNTLESHQQLDEKLEQISKLSKVHWAAVVTGRYDLIVEVVLAEPMSDLYKFMTGDLPKVGGIRSSETLMVMKARRKVIALPRGLKNW